MTSETISNDRYGAYLHRKTHSRNDAGFDPVFMPDQAFDFQCSLIEWSVRKGRAALFADCGLGKTLMELAWAENVARHTDGRVLLLTPLAVSAQTIAEGEKFGIEAHRSSDGKPKGRITVTNYEQLHKFDSSDYSGVICDEASILKSFDGARKSEITRFMRKAQYRLLATATAAPNDYIELGTCSEALGGLGYMDMLNKFFKNDQQNSATGRQWGSVSKFRLKGHAELPFWRWVCSWARAVRKPSDLGFSDGPFILPPLIEREHEVESSAILDGYLFAMPAVGLKEQREEMRRTIRERCDRVADIANNTTDPVLVWCHLNDEGDLLESLIPDSVQVSGSNPDHIKEDRFMAFAEGRARVLVTKPKIGAWGLNFQHCNHITFFPSHSFEQYYQGVRRCWRFGQQRIVHVDVITTEGGKDVLKNLRRKADQADTMFSNLVAEMNSAIAVDKSILATKKVEAPSWLQ